MTNGRRVASLLAGAWRTEPASGDLELDDLNAIAPVCLASGAAPLGWWRIRRGPLAHTESGRAFHDAFLHSSIEAVRHRRALAQIVDGLRRHQIEPIVVKGWAMARAYPLPGLRVYCDHDLSVRPRDTARARALMADTIGLGALADVHDGFAMLDDTDDDVLRDRAVEVDCDGTRLLVLAEEDHLRVLCRHLLRHGATRPLWLCDVAVAVETRSPSFDWTRCLGASRRVEQWVIRALQLAHAMLGMSIENTPAAGHRSRLPAWVVPAVADSWSKISFGFSKLGHSFDSPSGFFGEVRRHWPNPLQATVAVRGPINAVPRLPFQVAACLPGLLRTTRDALQRYQRAHALAPARNVTHRP